MNIVVNFDTLKKIEHLNFRRDNDLKSFGINTCCDYVDSLRYEDDCFGVTVFVEPCGNITKWGRSWNIILDWWITVFATQPDDWDYCKAGWHLWRLAEDDLLDLNDDDASLIWRKS